MYKGVG